MRKQGDFEGLRKTREEYNVSSRFFRKSKDTLFEQGGTATFHNFVFIFHFFYEASNDLPVPSLTKLNLWQDRDEGQGSGKKRTTRRRKLIYGIPTVPMEVSRRILRDFRR